MHAKRSVVTKSWLHLGLAAAAALAIGCGPGVSAEEGEAPVPVEEAPTVSAQSEYCPASGGYCQVSSGSVFCGRNRPMANAFMTPDGWCIHWLACGQDRPICALGNNEN